MANSSERLFHSHTGLWFGVPCGWWLKWAIILIFLQKIFSLWLVTYWSFHVLQALGMWALDHCLLSSWQRVEIYILLLHASKTPSSPGFSSGWHFSCHAIQFGPNWGWADSPPPVAPLPKLTTIVRSWRTPLAGLALCYIFVEDWISAALDEKVYPADFHVQPLS